MEVAVSHIPRMASNSSDRHNASTYLRRAKTSGEIGHSKLVWNKVGSRRSNSTNQRATFVEIGEELHRKDREFIVCFFLGLSICLAVLMLFVTLMCCLRDKS